MPVDGEHENAPHVVTTGDGKYFVKLLTPRLSAMPALEARHAFVDHLVKAKVSVPRLIRTSDGGGCVREGPRAVEVYEHIAGEPMGPGDGSQVMRAGMLLSEVHRAAESFRSPTPGMRRDWLTPDGDLAKLDAIRRQMVTYVPAPEMFEPLERVRRVLVESAKSLSEANLPTHMIHGSFFPGNMIFVRKTWVLGFRPLFITDFDYCHVAPRVLDVAAGFIAFGEYYGTGEPRWAGWELIDEGYRGPDVLDDGELRASTPALRRVLIHLRLDEGASPEMIAEELEAMESH